MVTRRVEVHYLDGRSVLVEPAKRHPAAFSPGILAEIAPRLSEELGRITNVRGAAAAGLDPRLVLDPFAGTGLVHSLRETAGAHTYGVEIEPGWVAWSPIFTRVGDATALPEHWTARFAAAVTSPCYANRMADKHKNRDKCKHRVKTKGVVRTYSLADCPKCKGTGISPRRSYTHDMGHALMENNAGAMQWGPEYRALHRAALAEIYRVLRDDAPFYLNVKNHIRNKRVVRVASWHLRTAQSLGFVREETIRVPLSGMRYGANHGARVNHELIYVLRK